MNYIYCPNCSGKLKMDDEETRKNGIMMVYCCEGCSKLYTLNCIGEKPPGWRTKAKLKEKELIDSIPF